jgi:hypothetical protein
VCELKGSVILLSDNAQLHAAHTVQRQLNAMLQEVLIHLANSRCLLPCNFNVFGPLRKVLKFSWFDDMQQTVLQWLWQQAGYTNM